MIVPFDFLNGDLDDVERGLAKVYHTGQNKIWNGREVLDASGITPDVIVDKKKHDKVVVALLSNNLIFKYATEYVLKHDTISPANQFKLGDADYNDFLAYINEKEYDFETVIDKSVELLRKKAEKENVLEKIEQGINLIEQKLMDIRKEQITHQKKHIKKLLEVEIATRFYLQKGRIQNNLSDDPDIEEALKILSEKDRYKAILSKK